MLQVRGDYKQDLRETGNVYLTRDSETVWSVVFASKAQSESEASMIFERIRETLSEYEADKLKREAREKRNKEEMEREARGLQKRTYAKYL